MTALTVISRPDLSLLLLVGMAVLTVAAAVSPLFSPRRPAGGSVYTPIKTTSEATEVILRVDPAGARAIADAVEFAYASGFLADTTRPTYLAEVAMIRQAAAYADDLAGNPLPDPVRVPLLRVVGGELA